MNRDAMISWLHKQIESGNLITKDTSLIDVGAYKGDFTRHFLTHIDTAMLFEANKNSFDQLQATFSASQNVTVIHSAISDEQGSIYFYCNDDPATGSLLPYSYTSKNIKSEEVTLTTLDHCLGHFAKRISIIKIDTQGNDLRVLKGAAQTIQHHQPWIIAELIFLPLYQNQANPHDIAAWLGEKGYVQAGIFNVHYSSDGWLAFADGVFIPKDSIKSIKQPFYLDALPQDVIEENIELKRVCAERLALINQLDSQLSKKCVSKNNILTKLVKKAASCRKFFQ